MKPTHALFAAAFAGVATFELQNVLVGPQAHAAQFQVPTGPDWRQQMIERDPGAPGVDQALARLDQNLSLSADQAQKIRPLLQQRHDRILALLLTAPASLTLNQFMVQRRRITADMHGRMDALLDRDQLEFARDWRAQRAQG